MDPKDLKESLRGVISFAITPFDQDQRLDLEALQANIAWMAGTGVHHIAVAGAVGEFYALTADEFAQVVEVAVDAASGRVPILAGIGHSTGIACHLARKAEEAGAAGLLINPLYLVSPGDEGLFRHHQALAEASDLGQIVFSTRGYPYSADTLARIADVASVVGLKDELGNLGLFLDAVERLGDRFAWINGMAEAYTAPYFAAGATSFTTGLANFAPQIPLAVLAAAQTGDYPRCRAIVSQQVGPLARLRSKRPGYHIAVIKEAMEVLGRRAGPCRLPLLPMTHGDRAELDRILEGLPATA